MSLLKTQNIPLDQKDITINITAKIENERSDFRLKVDSSIGAEDISYESPIIQGGVLTKGNATYVFSSVNEEEKYSADFFECTGLVGAGVSRENGKKISFLSHQDPIVFLYDYRESFLRDLGLKIEELKDLSMGGKVGLGLFGGKITDYKLYDNNYTRSVILLRKEIRKLLDNELIILVGPNNIMQNSKICTEDSSSHFFYNNNSSILHTYKPKQINEISNSSFPSGEVYDVLSQCNENELQSGT